MTIKNNAATKSLFTLLIIILFLSTIIAQSNNENEESFGIKNKLWYGINIGNIGISTGRFDTNLSLMGGYKITKSINVGAIIHGYYTYIWQRGDLPNYRIFDYGFGGLANIKVFRNYFAQVEVDQLYLTEIRFGEKIQSPYVFMYVGGGYKYQSPGDWSFMITLLYNVNPDSNQDFFPLDYRVGFVHNF